MVEIGKIRLLGLIGITLTGSSAIWQERRLTMKRLLFFLMVFTFVFLCFFAAKSFATPGTPESVGASPKETYSWTEKLKRGGLNIVSSPVEIARSIQVTSNEESLLKGWTVGLVKGFGDGFLRLGAGLVDVLTCPFNFPDSNKGPLIQPEYVWEKPGPKYS